MKNKKGFTLIELLAVIIILGVILAIAVPRVLNVINTQKTNSFEASVGMLAAGLKNAVLDGSVSTTSGDCDTVAIPGIRYTLADYTDCAWTANLSTYEVEVISKGAPAGKYGTQSSFTATR